MGEGLGGGFEGLCHAEEGVGEGFLLGAVVG